MDNGTVRLLTVSLVLASMIFCSTIISATNYNYDPNVNIWEIPSAPGQLLQTLDLVTSDTRLLHAPQTTTLAVVAASPPPVVIQRKVGELTSREDANTNTNAEQAAEANSGEGTYRYDQAYDEFVRRYFGHAAEEANAASLKADEDVDEDYGNEEGFDEQIPDASTTQKCRKVRRKHQDCEICQNSRNGEKSESCSYSTESEPQRYSYGKERNYRRSRNSQDESAEEDEAEPEVEKDNDNDEQVKKTKAKKSVAEESKDAGSSSCVKKTKRHSVCYYCEQSRGQKKMVKCYAGNTTNKSPKLASSGAGDGGSAKDKNAHKVQKTQQRIYKRTITHSTWREAK